MNKVSLKSSLKVIAFHQLSTNLLATLIQVKKYLTIYDILKPSPNEIRSYFTSIFDHLPV